MPDLTRLLNCSKRTAYSVINRGSIEAVNLSEHKTIIELLSSLNSISIFWFCDSRKFFFSIAISSVRACLNVSSFGLFPLSTTIEMVFVFDCC